MDYSQFEKKYSLEKLNEEQKTAVQTVKGPVLLLAVPGSGKTTVLTCRIGYMIYACNIKPKNILTVTYTVASAKDMKERYCKIFGEEHINELTFKTINSFAVMVLKVVKKAYPLAAVPTLAENRQINKIVTELYKNIYKEYPTEQEVDKIKNDIGYCKNMMIGPETMRDRNDTGTLFSLLFSSYNKALNKMGFMDFDDQIIFALEAFERLPKLKAAFQNKFQYILVDEAQDTSKIQHKLIHMLAGEKENVFLVGDEDQSIYGFRGAFPEALVNFQTEAYPNGKVLYMEENYRSSPQIVNVADNLIAKNKMRHKKHIKAVSEEGCKIRGIKIGDRKEQDSTLCKVAAELETSKETAAVLYRENDSAIAIIDALERKGLAYNCKGIDTYFFSSRIVTDIKNFLLFALDPTITELFMHLYYKMDLYLKKETAIKACNMAQTNGSNVLDALKQVADNNSQKRKANDIKKTFELIRKRETQPPSYAKNNVVSYAINSIVFETGYIIKIEQSDNDMNKLSIVLRIAERENSIASFLKRLDELEAIVRAGKQTISNFTLSTIHSSKGLEYDAVYLVDFFDGILPKADLDIKGSKSTPAEKEEERRLCYVAVTRAKKQLIAFIDKNIYSGKYLKEMFSNAATSSVEQVDK